MTTTLDKLTAAYADALSGSRVKSADLSDDIENTIRMTHGAGLAGVAAGVPMGGLVGYGRGNTAEGMGRGMVRGGFTGAGAGLGGSLAAMLARGVGLQGTAGTLATGAGMGLGGLGGWLTAGSALGEPSTSRKRKRRDYDKEAAHPPKKPHRPRAVMIIRHTRVIAHHPLAKLKAMARLPTPESEEHHPMEGFSWCPGGMDDLLGHLTGDHDSGEERGEKEEREESSKEEEKEEGRTLKTRATDLVEGGGGPPPEKEKKAAFSFEYDLPPDQAQFTVEGPTESPFAWCGLPSS